MYAVMQSGTSYWLARDGARKMGPYRTRAAAARTAEMMNAPKIEDPRTTRERAILASLNVRRAR